MSVQVNGTTTTVTDSVYDLMAPAGSVYAQYYGGGNNTIDASDATLLMGAANEPFTGTIVIAPYSATNTYDKLVFMNTGVSMESVVNDELKLQLAIPDNAGPGVFYDTLNLFVAPNASDIPQLSAADFKITTVDYPDSGVLKETIITITPPHVTPSATAKAPDTVAAADTAKAPDTVAASTGGRTINGGTGAFNFIGASGDTVYGGHGGGILSGSSGNHETLVANGGNTTIFGGTGGYDVLVAGAGTTMIASTDNDLVFASGGNSTVYGTAHGQDTLVGGNAGSAVMVGSTGNDQMWGGLGRDTLYGGSGNDTLGGGTGNAVIVAGSGNTTLVGGSGDQTFVGGDGHSTVFGGTGNSTIFTGGGTGTVVLQGGNDLVDLQSGHVTVFAGSGAVSFDLINGTAGGHDMIAGFNPGMDHIDLSGYGGATPSVTHSGGSTVLGLSDGTQVTLLGVSHLPAGAIG